MARFKQYSVWPLVIVASLAGGLAEVAWIWFYGAVTSAGSADIARQVAASIWPAWGESANAAALGIGLHLGLAIVMGGAFAFIVWRPFVRGRGAPAVLSAALAALSAIWAVNFFVVLPVLNPLFPTLLPYAVTFVSKALFAVAMAGMLIAGDRGHLS